MPTVTINRKVFEELVGRKLPDEELKDRISMLGTDLEHVDEKEIKVEIFPNRPDMLSEQGFARAFSSFIGVTAGLRKYEVKKSPYRLIVEDSVKEVRPYTACSIVRNLNFNDERIREIIQIQEKLHTTFGRNRKKVAIGIYPNEKIKYPIYFRALAPQKIKFRPLESNKEMTAKEIIEEHPKGKEYAHLLSGLNKYAVFQDVEDKILSLTPIINSHDTGKINENSKDVFIECSGFDFEACQLCLNIITTALADMGGAVYSLSLEYGNNHYTSPNLKHKEMSIDLNYVNKILGLELNSSDLDKLLSKMGFSLKKRGKKLYVQIPCYRADIMHQIDFVEDIAIAYGYENFIEEIPQVMTIAEENPFEVFSNKVAYIMTGLGFLETFTYHISSNEKENDMMNAKNRLIEISNAVSIEQNSMRFSMISSLLEVLKDNKHHELPHKLFDIGVTFSHDGESETGVLEEKKAGVVLCDENADYTKIRQILDYILRNLGIEDYKVQDAKNSSFIDGRFAEVYLNGNLIAKLGEINPVVINNWQLQVPVAALEINLSKLFGLF